MKYLIRRFVFGIVTLPIAFTAYGLVYFGFGLLSEYGVASVTAYLANLPAVGFSYVVLITLLPQLFAFVDRVVD